MEVPDDEPPPQRPPRRQKRKPPPTPKGEQQQARAVYDFARPGMPEKADYSSCTSVYDYARLPNGTAGLSGTDTQGIQTVAVCQSCSVCVNLIICLIRRLLSQSSQQN